MQQGDVTQVTSVMLNVTGGLYSEDFVFYEKSNKTGEMAVSAGKPTAHLLRYKGWRKRNNKRFKGKI